MKKYSFFTLLLSITIIIGFSSGCQKKTSVLLQDTMCKYPCWQNINPGVTSGMELIDILSKLQFVDSPPTSVVKSNPGESYTSWVFKKGYNEGAARVVLLNDKVAYIEFVNIHQIQVGDLIANYGKPEIISAISDWADSRWLKIYWIYPKQGVIFTFWEGNWRSNDNIVNIIPSMPVDKVIYFQPGALDSIMEDVFEQWDKNVILRSFQSWGDFGSVPVTSPENPY